jgi:DNA-binding NtrC family response regulator
LKQRLLAAQRQTLERELDRPYDEMIGASPAMQAVRQQMALFAATESTVLIIGESGVGKELVARQIYHMSPRKDKPFITVNCPAIPKDLLESDLFGHEKGAFTGAQARRIGKFELADDGTIFLDEIAELALEAQAKLLRVLQEKEFERIGGGTTLRTQARVIAATSRDLEEMVHRQQFREDLFYRLNVLPIRVPSLIDRKDDVPLLVNHFLKRTSVDINVPVKPLAPEAMALLTEYPWPGNVRELQNCMTRLVISTQHKDHIDQGTVAAMLGAARLVQMERTKVPQSWEEMDSLRTTAMQDAAREVERLFLEHLLQRFQGNVTKAAEHIGINRNSFHKLMRKCGMRAHPFKSKEEES